MTRPTPPFRVLAFYTTTVEPHHVLFADAAIRLYTALADKHRFEFEATTDWARMNDADLATYQVVLWLNDFPQNQTQRSTFERYTENRGAWLGFHVSGYNDRHTGWPWFVDFLGGAVFHTNNWPPLPAILTVDDLLHPVSQGMPPTYTAPADEWYQWKPSPRLDPEVHVLLTLSPANFPLGEKDLLTSGDIPVVWTNTRFRMIYLNMGHLDKAFDSAIQNSLFKKALLWAAAQIP